MRLRFNGDVQIELPDQIGSISTFVALEQEDWFEDEIEFARLLAKDAKLVIDVGASFRFYTLATARNMGPSGKVISFEPNSATRDCLRRSIDLNHMKNVELYPNSLSNNNGSSRLSFNRDSELGSISPQLSSKNANYEIVEKRNLDRLGEPPAQQKFRAGNLDPVFGKEKGER